MSLRDFDRGLNARGLRGAALMGRHIAEHGIAWDMALASPAERVRRTLAASGLDLAVQFADRAYLADSLALLELVQALPDDAARVLVVGHNPGLQDLALDLLGADTGGPLFDQLAAKFPTAAFAVLQLDIARWADCAPGCAKLMHFARPRDLDPDLGPLMQG